MFGTKINKHIKRKPNDFMVCRVKLHELGAQQYHT